MRKLTMVLLALFLPLGLLAADKPIRKDAKVFIAPMGGFENDLREAFKTKHLPLEIVEKKDYADYEIDGASQSTKAGTAKKVIALNWHSDEEASIHVTDLKSGAIIYSYSVAKPSSAHGRRSTAEACAKHLKDHVQ